MVRYELGYGGGGNVFDQGEGGEKEYRRGSGRWVGIGGNWGGESHVGGGEHEFLSLVVSFLLLLKDVLGRRTPLVGSILQSLTASMTLPFSSATSLTQSAFPVATSMCVAHPLTCP